ncbi:MAG: hypothetical protein ACI8UO_000025 [Verrucomicrobiales bacterium]|jgi:hypothetical protein
MCFEILRCDPPLEIRIESGKAGANLDLPLSVPLQFAEAGRDSDVLLWSEADVVGLFHPRSRLAWSVESISIVNIAELEPAKGPGVVGLEIGITGAEESPVLASSCWSEEAVAWFQSYRNVFAKFFQTEIGEANYGLDR